MFHVLSDFLAVFNFVYFYLLLQQNCSIVHYFSYIFYRNEKGQITGFKKGYSNKGTMSFISCPAEILGRIQSTFRETCLKKIRVFVYHKKCGCTRKSLKRTHARHSRSSLTEEHYGAIRNIHEEAVYHCQLLYEINYAYRRVRCEFFHQRSDFAS